MTQEFTEEELAQERWMPIANTNGIYDVSNLGRVRSWTGTSPKPKRHDKPRLLSRILQRIGYYAVTLYYPDGTHRIEMVHRLVASAFIPNSDDLPCINHKDEIKTNNRVDNLEWCTYKYNASYGTCVERIKSKLNKAVVCVETGERWKSVNECAESIGMDAGCISQCCTGRSNTCCGRHLKFVEDVDIPLAAEGYCSSEQNGELEEWRTIPDYPKHYEVSNLGRVRRICKYKHGAVETKILAQSVSRAGFSMVKMQLDGHKDAILKTVHRLVCLAFLPTDDTSLLTSHINGVKTDNRLSNLMWCTRNKTNI